MSWIASQTDRFACIVNHAGVCDFQTQYASDVTHGRARSMGGEPWVNLDGMDRYNPMRHASGFRTPMLILHGTKDYRVPSDQALAIYPQVPSFQIRILAGNAAGRPDVVVETFAALTRYFTDETAKLPPSERDQVLLLFQQALDYFPTVIEDPRLRRDRTAEDWSFLWSLDRGNCSVGVAAAKYGKKGAQEDLKVKPQ